MAPRAPRLARRRTAGRGALGAVVLVLTAGFYLLLIDTLSLPELYAGVVIVALAWIAFAVSRGQGFAEQSFDPRWLRRAGHVIAAVPRHAVVLCVEALAQLRSRRPVRGRFRAVAFRGGDGHRDRGRYATTELLGSLAPNTIVVGIDPDRELLLVHQLHPEGGREQLDQLRLG
jgi:multisubunit Na+/H+ antiporter MnhE subunit